MRRYPIETAPHDGRKILAFGTYGWESLTGHTEKGWLVVRWEPKLTWTEDGEPVGGWKSETANPYKDYMIATHWAPLPDEPE